MHVLAARWTREAVRMGSGGDRGVKCRTPVKLSCINTQCSASPDSFHASPSTPATAPRVESNASFLPFQLGGGDGKGASPASVRSMAVICIVPGTPLHAVTALSPPRSRLDSHRPPPGLSTASVSSVLRFWLWLARPTSGGWRCGGRQRAVGARDSSTSRCRH